MLVKFSQNLVKTFFSFQQPYFIKPEVIQHCRWSSHEVCASSTESAERTHKHENSDRSEPEELSTEPEYHTKLLKFAILGNPNAGKSTLINRLVNRTVFACSSKVHTTKCTARAVFNEGDTQLIILDTPGLVTGTESKKYNLDQSFHADAEKSLNDADIIGILHDTSIKTVRDKLDIKVLRLLNLYPKKHYILILNKVDCVKSKTLLLDMVNVLTNKTLRAQREKEAAQKEDAALQERGEPLTEKAVLERIKNMRGWSGFNEIFMISAKFGDGVDDIRTYLLRHAKPRKWIFPEEVFTDKSPENLIKEAVRSQLLESLPHEVPYNLDIQMEYLEVTPEGTIVTVVLVKCDTLRLQKLVLGAGGGRIRNIGRYVEQELANTFYTVVKVKLVVTSKNPAEMKEKDSIAV